VVFDNYFMVIPVYRLSEDKYYFQMNDDFERRVSQSWDDSFRQENPGLEDNKNCTFALPVPTMYSQADAPASDHMCHPTP